MTNEKLIQAWIDYCNKIVTEEWTVTRAEAAPGRNAPRPEGPYLTLKIISGPGHLTLDDELRSNGKDEGERNFDLVGQRSYTISIKAYRSGHNDILNDISTCLDEPDLYEFLKETANIAVTNRGAVIDISGLIETGYEGRSSLDIFFNSTNIKEVGVGLIEGVQVSGGLETEGGRVINTNMPDINKE